MDLTPQPHKILIRAIFEPMRSFILSILLACVCFSMESSAQIFDPEEIQPDTVYENIFVKQLYSDSLSGSFIIWVKEQVPAHRHLHHTEVVTVIEGAATFRLGNESREVKKGDIIVIPAGTVHSAITTSKTPLKVLSVQSPEFDGSDREMAY